jgi:hypothetical protein
VRIVIPLRYACGWEAGSRRRACPRPRDAPEPGLGRG